MEQLSKRKRTALKKMSTDRVRQRLLGYGKVQEEVAVLERDVLLEELAKAWIQEEMEEGEGAVVFGEVKSESESEGSAQSSDDGEGSEKSEDKEGRWRREEMALRREEMASRDREFERQMEMQKAARKEELEAQRLENKRQKEQEDTPIIKLKRFGDAMKHVLPRMPVDLAEIPLYFETVENALKSFNVEKGYWVKLLLPLMTYKARAVLNRLSYREHDDYERVKEYILKEFKLTPREYRAKFLEAKKLPDETYTLFNTRLKNLFNYYVHSRDVKQDFNKLCDLMVADRLKEALPYGQLQFVLMKEGTECLTSDMIADLADLHVNNKIGYVGVPKPTYDKGKLSDVTMYQGKGQGDREMKERTFVKDKMADRSKYVKPEMKKGFAEKSERRCFACGSGSHFVKDCTKRQSREVSARACALEEIDTNWIPVMNRSEREDEREIETRPKVVMKCTVEKENLEQEVNEMKTETNVNCCNAKVVLKKATLEHLDIEINVDGIQQRRVKCLIDSGTEITVVSKEVIKGLPVTEMGEVSIQGAAGKPVLAKLVKLELRLTNKDDSDNSSKLLNIGTYLPVVCAVLDNMSGREKFLVHPETIEELKSLPQILVHDARVQSNVLTRAQTRKQLNREVSQDTEEMEEAEIEGMNLENLFSNEEVKREEGNGLLPEQKVMDSMLFERQQKQDQSLGKWFEKAKEGNSEFCVNSGLLYR